jgi:DNA ligase-1
VSYDSIEEAEAYAAQLKDQGGYDGAVLRDIDAPYKVGRCRNGEVVKIKPLLELDLLVLGCELAKGEKTGKNTAALVVRYKDGKPCRVSTGLKQAEVDSIHEDPAAWKGRIIAVEAMAETEDGLLREPRYKGVRYDKAAPDF